LPIDIQIQLKDFLGNYYNAIRDNKNGFACYSYGYHDIPNKKQNAHNIIFQVGSMTKHFTAALVLKLAEQQKFSVDAKIS
jgi:CubicO group peptidase (beta-lactamase class C family)